MCWLGVDFKVKVMDAAGPDGRPKRVKVTIWDTGKAHHFHMISTLLYQPRFCVYAAGQERFRTLTSSYYRGAQGIILGKPPVYLCIHRHPQLTTALQPRHACVCVVYDVTRKETFDSLNMWLQEVEQFSMGGGKEVVKLLVGNKVDQARIVQREVANDWARSRGMLFMEASAKTKEGIAQVFQEVVQKVGQLVHSAYYCYLRSKLYKTHHIHTMDTYYRYGLCMLCRCWRTPPCCRI
ncbi:hypothetical protein EON65_58325, partial [archaeon]